MKLLPIAPLMLALASPAFSALYSSGHADIGIAYEDEGSGPEFYFHYHIEGGIVDGIARPDEEFDADQITVLVGSSTEITMPNNAALIAGTGVSAGGSLWRLPEAEQTGVPYLGIATEELSMMGFGPVTFELGAVTSPSGSGNFSLWQSDGIGGFNFFFSTADEAGTVNGDNTLVLPTGTHAHYNYGFSEVGTWNIEMTVSSTNSDPGIGFQTSTETFTFNVVPEPSSALLAALGSLALLRRRR